MTARIRLTRIDVVPGCSITKCAGIDSEGRTVLVQAEWRAALPIADALEVVDAVDVYLDDWRVVAWKRA